MLIKLFLILSVIWLIGCDEESEPKGHIGVVLDGDAHYYPVNPGQDDQSEYDKPLSEQIGYTIFSPDMEGKFKAHHNELHIRLDECRRDKNGR